MKYLLFDNEYFEETGLTEPRLPIRSRVRQYSDKFDIVVAYDCFFFC